MKTASLLLLVTFFSVSFANAETGEICGTLNLNEGCLSEYDTGKPKGVCLMGPATTKSNYAYFLKAKNAKQKSILASLEQYNEYCVQGELFWCGKNQDYKCLTVESVQE